MLLEFLCTRPAPGVFLPGDPPMSFLRALSLVLEFEGGYSDHPLDRGGKTQFGITQGHYIAWRVRRGLHVRPVAELTREEVIEIYHEDYWRAAGCDDLRWPLNACVFDCAVQFGAINAVRFLQTALAVEADGQYGPLTFAALNDARPRALLLKLNDVRCDTHCDVVKRHPEQREFIKGWMRRVRKLERKLLHDAT
jgi:lysozyme family protein